ncbi:MAG: MerC domain-containing protein [Pseudomonadales bacterium]
MSMSSSANVLNSRAPNRIDRIAIMLSTLCLLHCLLIPVVVVLAPAFSSVVLGTETTVHWIFLALAVPISCWALLRGYRRSRRRAGLGAGLVGLLVMFLGVSHLFDPALEVPLTVLGVSLVVVAHALNLRGELIPSVIQAFGVETQDGGGQN